MQPRQNYQIPDAGGTTTQEWNVIACLQALSRHKVALVYILSAGIVAASLISLAQARWYRSEALLEIQGINENFLNTRDINPAMASSGDSNGTYVQTQAELLQQDTLIEQVIKKLHLETRLEFQRRLGTWAKFRRLIGLGPASVPEVDNTIEIVKKNINIVPSRASRIIRIVCDARDPQVAAELANTLAQAFIEQSTETRLQAARQIHMSLSLELAELRKKLLKSEAQLAVAARAPWSPLGLSRQHSSAGGSNMTAESLTYNILRREVESDRRFYETMSQRANDARIAATVRQSNIVLAGPARPSSHPYKPNLPLNVAIGIVGNMILGIGWVMFREQTNSLLRTPGEAGIYLTLPELGAIPQLSAPGLAAQLLPLRAENQGVDIPVTIPQPSPLSESFRATLASILSTSRNGHRAHILLITSARPMEGKTTVASNLAVGLAEIGRKVLLIDGDMRRPRMNKVFDQPNSWGLSDILREKNAIEDLPLDVLVKQTAVPGVCLLPSGVCADNIFGLLWSDRLARLLPRFRQVFDYVLVDAPPCLEFADARIIARYTDQLLLVVRANYTDRRIARDAVQRLLSDGIPMMGVILNRCDPAQSDMYSYPFYYGLNPRGLA